MHQEKGSIYSLDTINNEGPPTKMMSKPYFKCLNIGLHTVIIYIKNIE